MERFYDGENAQMNIWLYLSDTLVYDTKLGGSYDNCDLREHEQFHNSATCWS